MPRPLQFLVLSLPRSRSWWLANFLAQEGPVRHDALAFCDTLADFFGPYDRGEIIGSCETAGVDGWRLIRARMPELRVLVVRREPADVLRSLALHGWSGEAVAQDVLMRNEMLDACARSPGVLEVQYADLTSRRTCNRVFEHCVGLRLGDERWEYFRNRNLQIDLPERAAKLRERQGQIGMLKLELAAANAQGRVWPSAVTRGLQ